MLSKINIAHVECQTTFLSQSSYFCLGHHFNLQGNKTSLQKKILTNGKLKSLSSLQRNFCFQLLCVFNVYSHVPAFVVVWQNSSISHSPNVICFSKPFPTLFPLVGFHKSYLFFHIQLKSHSELQPELLSPDSPSSPILYSFSTEELLVNRDISIHVSLYS